jgi:chaperone BCS1
MVNKPVDDELTLEYVLNILDGIVEMHDAIIVFTTNHIEEIDPAVIRPGRVDYMLELKNATAETIEEMIKYKYKLTDEEMLKYKDKINKISKISVSPAKVQNLCFTHKNIEDILEELLKV